MIFRISGSFSPARISEEWHRLLKQAVTARNAQVFSMKHTVVEGRITLNNVNVEEQVAVFALQSRLPKKGDRFPSISCTLIDDVVL